MHTRGRPGGGHSERSRTAVLLLTCVFISVVAAPVRPGVVLGESMSPAFHNGQVFLAAPLSNPEGIATGDVVLVDVEGQVLLKRVYAVAGQEVWGLRSDDYGALFERVIPESEVSRVRQLAGTYRGLGELQVLEVPPGHVFVLGDSQADSYDSRHFGAVSVERVRGKVVVSRLLHLWKPDASGNGVAAAQERGEL